MEGQPDAQPVDAVIVPFAGETKSGTLHPFAPGMMDSPLESLTGLSKARRSTNVSITDIRQSRLVFYLLLAVATVYGLIALILMISADTSAFPDNTYGWDAGSSLHATIMMLFAVIVHGYGTLMYRILPWQIDKFIVKLVHGGVGALVALLMLVALFSVRAMKDKKGFPHYHTLHSWIGIGAIAVFIAQLLAGAFTFLLPVTPGKIRAAALPLHQAAGLFVFIACGTSALTGMAGKTGYVAKVVGGKKNSTIGEDEFYDEEFMYLFSGILLLLFIGLVACLVTAAAFGRRPKM